MVLCLEKNELARGEKLENHKSLERSRTQLTRSLKCQAKQPGAWTYSGKGSDRMENGVKTSPVVEQRKNERLVTT